MASKTENLLKLYPEVSSLVDDIYCSRFTKALLLRESMPQHNEPGHRKTKKPRERELLDVLSGLTAEGMLCETQIKSPPLVDYANGPIYSSIRDGVINSCVEGVQRKLRLRWVNRPKPHSMRAFVPREASKLLRINGYDPLEDPNEGLTYLDLTNLYLFLRQTRSPLKGWIPWWLGALLQPDPTYKYTPHASYSFPDGGMAVALVCQDYKDKIYFLIDFAEHWCSQGYVVELW